MEINWDLGLQGLALGLGAVFLVLVVLIVLILVLGKVANSNTKKDKTKEKVVEPVANPVVVSQNYEDEIIAAITAAIAYIGQKEGKKFKIRSYKRV